MDLSLLNVPNEENEKVMNYDLKAYEIMENFTLFFHADSEFNAPRGVLKIKCNYPSSIISAKTSVVNRIYIELVKDSINEMIYPAIDMGFEYEIDPISGGFFVSVDGWSDTCGVLLTQIIKAIFDTESIFDEERFKIITQEVIRKLENFKTKPAVRQAMTDVFFALISTPEGFHREQLLKFGSDIAYSDIEQFKEKRFELGCRIDLLVSGNFSFEKAINIANDLSSAMKWKEQLEKRFFSMNLIRKRIVKIGQGENCLLRIPGRNLEDKNNVVVLCVQLGLLQDIPEKQVLLDVFDCICSPLFFDELRTKKGSGYDCMAYPRRLHNSSFYFFVVGSHVFSCKETESNIISFINKVMKERVDALTKEELVEIVSGLRAKYLEPFRNLNETSDFFWGEIDNMQNRFSRLIDKANALSTVNMEEFEKFSQDYFFDETSRSFFFFESFSTFLNEKIQQSDDGISNLRKFESFEGFKLFNSSFPSSSVPSSNSNRVEKISIRSVEC